MLKVSQDDLPRYYHAADLYVSASHTDGTSISLLESFGSGELEYDSSQILTSTMQALLFVCQTFLQTTNGSQKESRFVSQNCSFY